MADEGIVDNLVMWQSTCVIGVENDRSIAVSGCCATNLALVSPCWSRADTELKTLVNEVDALVVVCLTRSLLYVSQ